MNTIISSPPSTIDVTVFHRRSSHTTSFPSLPKPNQLFHSFTSNITLANLRCNDFYKKKSKGIQQQRDFPSASEQHEINKYVKEIQSIFGSMEDGAITLSAYDTAWVALIKNVDETSGGPQFPSSLQWVVNNQLPDGSWGEPLFFSAFDRLLNTLACVIALTSWNIHPDKCEKGIKFVEENMNKIGDENIDEHMTPGFEVLFPSLIESAQKLNIKVQNDTPILRKIYARRALRLEKMPKDKFHNTPTILLYSLEGMRNLEWEKILKLQSENGSFAYSPAATAFAFMQTKDQKCLKYLTDLVVKFNGGVTHMYPMDLFEHSWIVDRLQRLGIARYFCSEIKDCLDYIYRYWDEHGIGFARNFEIPDLDDTAMAFRVLRTNGYKVSPDVFRHFEKDGQFMCYPGQSRETVTVMFNLYRASQVVFPGEKILDDAKKISHNFLTEKKSSSELLDRWVITKDLPGEVGFALDVPWYASLPRLEARYYLEQYGGDEDVWIAKTLFRMKNVSNKKYLEMAKLDYNLCQAIHQSEWRHMQKWYAEFNIEEDLDSRLLWSYYEAAASIFEPERSNERLAWAKTTVLLNTINSYFAKNQFSNDESQHENRTPWLVTYVLHETLNQISSETLVAHGSEIRPHLHRAWRTWLLSLQNGVGVAQGAELIVQTIHMSSGQRLPDEPLSHPQYKRLLYAINELCHKISHKRNHTIGFEVDSKMQELVQLVLCDSPGDLDHNLKQTFLTVAKTFYYRAHFDAETINRHVGRVLFECVK